jgi:exonuclease SbcD
MMEDSTGLQKKLWVLPVEPPREKTTFTTLSERLYGVHAYPRATMKVLHTGDTHLGYQQYHKPARREDFRAAFEQVAEDAVTDDVDAVVHAGDLFHDRTPTLTDIMGAMSVLRILDDADIPFLAIVGNHESKRDQQWLDLFEDMGLATRLGPEPLTIGETAFYGLDFVPRAKREAYEYDFGNHDAEHAALVSHGLFEPFDHGDWDVRRVLDDSPVDFDIVLLGDDHAPQQRHIDEPTDAWLTYCGSTERASASERDPRGYNLVTFDDGVDIRRRGLDTRDFVFIDEELNEGEGSAVIRRRLDEHDVEDAVVIVTITGEGEQVLPAGIEEVAADQGALATRVNDQRELTDEADVDVQFADPDEAVRERIEEMGLSPVAREVDETIRASKVVDSNVADTVERRVGDIIDEADDGAFEAVSHVDDQSTPDEQSDQSTPDEQSDQPTAETESTQQTDDSDPDQSGDDSQVTMEDYL